jgi:hypothetical protein
MIQLKNSIISYYRLVVRTPDCGSVNRSSTLRSGTFFIIFMEKIINNYKILEKIDEGSYAKVKKALNLEDNKFYAVKIFDKYIL